VTAENEADTPPDSADDAEAEVDDEESPSKKAKVKSEADENDENAFS
jgi:hypothetical protein